MSTRARDQQKEQRQKEFMERKEHQECLKIAAKKGKRGLSRNEDEIDRMPKSEE